MGPYAVDTRSVLGTMHHVNAIPATPSACLDLECIREVQAGCCDADADMGRLHGWQRALLYVEGSGGSKWLGWVPNTKAYNSPHDIQNVAASAQWCSWKI